MKGINKIIEAVRSESPLLEFFRAGIKPEEIKEQIISDFDPYFRNKDNLFKYSMTYLVSDWILYNKYRDNSWFKQKLSESLNMYRDASKRDVLACHDIFKQLIDDQIETGNRFWSFVFTETNKKDLEIYEFTQMTMNDIGRIVEGLFKTLLLEYISMYRLSKGKKVVVSDIKKLDLGIINNELIQTSIFLDLFSIRSLKLSDWRNIAYHHNYSIESEKIKCTYGPKDNRNTILLDKDELWAVLLEISRILDLLNLTHKFYFYDNDTEILQGFDSDSISGEARTEIWFLTFASALVAQGFDIISFETSKEFTKLIVRETIIDSDKRTRAIHSSQFTYNLWYYTSSVKLEVEYRDFENVPYLRASTTNEICEKIGSREKPFTYLAEFINLELLENDA
ncbi:hypothetical protein [Paenibacillus sp. FSL H7-0331]|uniref:hypothetical protein n=1 Tax=Paenibacillus sp. FSL H7-0331 TaxID=1920421 RepID=UPI00096DA114|nr:hypothetical protein [Paenibacillus sp. FSL H7-0331]OMF02628.1 hypothetical protein BK127_37100 [Paenibacillus sp. FSL H7-0331]